MVAKFKNGLTVGIVLMEVSNLKADSVNILKVVLFVQKYLVSSDSLILTFSQYDKQKPKTIFDPPYFLIRISAKTKHK